MPRLDEIGEFRLIERIRRLAGMPAGPGVALGIGDDAALLRLRAGEELAVTADTFVAGVHFDLAHESASGAGRRALVANLSDLAAMGARPLGCTLALAAPPAAALRDVLGLVRGLVAEAKREACPLVGGNVTRASEISLAITALGGVARGRALRRAGARPGDRLLVTGRLGVGALARARAEQTGGPLRWRPRARVAAGRALARARGVRACIDLSDGLLADLGHLLQASGVGAEVDAARVPRPRGFAAACRRLGVDADALALAGGEDWELLFSAAPAAPGAAVLARRLGVPVTEIGRVTRRGLQLANAQLPPAQSRGWRHF